MLVFGVEGADDEEVRGASAEGGGEEGGGGRKEGGGGGGVGSNNLCLHRRHLNQHDGVRSGGWDGVLKQLPVL